MDKGFIQQFIEWIIHNGGLYVLLFIVFAETGLFVGFFLPGDALLFAAGIYLEELSQELFGWHYMFVILLVLIASILGNMAAGIECEHDGNVPVTPDLVLKKIDTVERQANYK